MNCVIHSLFQFIFIHFTNQITSKQSLGQNLNPIFQLSSINWQINIPLWTCMGHDGWRKNKKTFTRCYTIVLKFWVELNANFFLLHFSCYREIKIWHLYLKNVEKNNKTMRFRLLFTYLRQNVFNIKKYLGLVLKKICPYTFLCIQN